MEERAGTDGRLLLGECDATFADGVVEILDGVEVAIDEGLVDECPQVLSGLQLRAVGRLEYEPKAVGHRQVLRTMPAGIVDLQHDALLLAGADRLGEVGQHKLEISLGNVVGDVPHRGARRRLHEARHIQPLEAMMTERDRPLTDGRPHPAGDRLQADAMLVRRPDLDLGVRMLAALGGDGGLKLF